MALESVSAGASGGSLCRTKAKERDSNPFPNGATAMESLGATSRTRS